MTREFDNVVDFQLGPEDLKISNHVSVGWGAKETQFHGKAARIRRDPTLPEIVDTGKIHPNDERDVGISWRGDGTFLAINSIEGARRVVRVFSREGQLDSSSEPIDNLQAALSWRPSGNVLASIQSLDDKLRVVFFERNGLRHGEFDLRLSKHETKTQIRLEWNLDSSVLAICMPNRVQLWTMGNYHYYLKQELSCSPSTTPQYIAWHPEKSLHLMTRIPGGIRRSVYTFAVVSSPSRPPNDYGTIAVVDGQTLKLTPLRAANIPPPYALQELCLDQNIVDAAISQGASANALQIAVLTKTNVFLYTWPISALHDEPPRLEWRKICEGEPFQLETQDSMWTTLSANFDHSIITRIEEDQQQHFSHCDMIIAGMGPWLGTQTTAENDSHILKCPSLTLQAVYAGDMLVRMDEKSALYANERCLVKNCTSFLVSPNHLIFTTSQNLLKFVHLNESLEIPPDTPETDERCRSVERGARLIAVMPSTFALVLQMPRGNLETIYPRALILASIRQSIADGDYGRAFFDCRCHRVDMNLIYDYAPAQFLANIFEFVQQVEKPEHIDLFLAQLKDEDVSQSMYRETLQHEPSSAAPQLQDQQGDQKTNTICQAFIACLQDDRLQNIITAFVCQSPPNLDSALDRIAQLSGAQKDAMIEHICFLADINRLYDQALGLYNLELTLLVAQRSQRDPREYVPFLQNLDSMPDLRRRFSIDDSLKRTTKALISLCQLDAFPEVQAYVAKHHLYSTALHFYRHREDRYRGLLRLYADHAYEKGQFREAGTAYEYLGELDLATTAYRQAHLWRECLTTAQQGPDDIRPLALSLAEYLSEAKDCHSAAVIHLDYVKDVEMAARLFCKGFHFADCRRISILHHRLDLLESVLDAGLTDAMSNMTELLADCKGQLNAQVPRLAELRVKKVEDPLAFWEGESNVDIPDDVSVAATNTSTAGGTLFTRYTNRTGTVATNATRQTSKNRRREERKRARGKKGSVYEEEYLIQSVARLIQRVNSVHDDISRLVDGLMQRGMRERAAAVSSAMVEVVALCESVSPQVFQDSSDAPLIPAFAKLSFLEA